jgi:hypothetical protein
MTTDGVEPARSSSVRARPDTTLIPMTSKKDGETMLYATS